MDISDQAEIIAAIENSYREDWDYTSITPWFDALVELCKVEGKKAVRREIDNIHQDYAFQKWLLVAKKNFGFSDQQAQVIWDQYKKN